MEAMDTKKKYLLFEDSKGEIRFIDYGNIQDAIDLYDKDWIFLSISNKSNLMKKVRTYCEECDIDIDSELPYNDLEDYINITIDDKGVDAPKALIEKFKTFGIELDLNDTGETIWVDEHQREIVSMSAEDGVYNYSNNVTLYTVRVNNLDEKHLKVLYRDDKWIFEEVVKEHYDNLGFSDDDMYIVRELDKIDEAIDKRFGYDKSTLDQVSIIEIDEDTYDNIYEHCCTYNSKFYMIE